MMFYHNVVVATSNHRYALSGPGCQPGPDNAYLSKFSHTHIILMTRYSANQAQIMHTSLNLATHT